MGAGLTCCEGGEETEAEETDPERENVYFQLHG